MPRHRHQPEIEEQLSLAAKKPLGITFVPHLVPMNRGILSTIYADLKKPLTLDAVRAVFKKYYGKETFVRIFPEGMLPQTGWVRGSNYCDMGFVLAGKKKLIIVSAIDNLVKGAAGQAVQNMNIMLGFKEEHGTGADSALSVKHNVKVQNLNDKYSNLCFVIHLAFELCHLIFNPGGL